MSMLKFIDCNQPKCESLMPTIGFIGGGNMAGSLIGGLINAGWIASDIIVTEPDDERRDTLSTKFNVATATDVNVLENCDIIILAVKPQTLKTVCQQLANNHISKPLFISIAAGVKKHRYQPLAKPQSTD